MTPLGNGIMPMGSANGGLASFLQTPSAPLAMLNPSNTVLATPKADPSTGNVDCQLVGNGAGMLAQGDDADDADFFFFDGSADGAGAGAVDQAGTGVADLFS